MTTDDPRAAIKNCSRCGFFCPDQHTESAETGTCRRHSPTVMPYALGYPEFLEGMGALCPPLGGLVTVFPHVGSGDWCGEWGDFDHLPSTAG